MLKDKEAVIFDLDGTLVDSMWVWTSIDDDYIEKYNLTEPEDFHERMEGMSYTETAQYFLEVFPSLPLTEDEIKKEWFQMAYDKYLTKVPLKAGVKDFLKRIKELGMKAGIATSNTKELVVDTLKALGVSEYFDSIRTSCEAAAGKPAPDVYLLVADDLGVVPERCLVFEDIPMGILAGKNAGMTVCAVEDDFSSQQAKKKKALADYYIYDYKDILNKTYEVLSK